MTTLLPLHSVVFCPAERIVEFPSHEVVSLADVGCQLVGADRRHDLTPIIYNELRHRIVLKLSLGERVIVPSDGLAEDQRRHISALAGFQGASVITIANEPIRPVRPLPAAVEPYLRQQWDGITVIGDVHGNLAAMKQALAWAKSRKHFVWFLGDVIDYGADTLATMECAYRAVMRGQAGLMLANHERKIARWLSRSEPVRLSDGNRVTTEAYARLSEPERQRWAGRFRALLAHATLIQQIGDLTMMHAAAHPSLWGHDHDPIGTERLALHGEADQSGPRYRRTHRWVDAVPGGQTVIVGHDILFQYPMVVTGANGGRVVFLDTGCGKGGHLSSADFRFTDSELRLECFKRY